MAGNLWIIRVATARDGSFLAGMLLEVLAEAGQPMEGRDVLARMSERLELTPYWLKRYNSGQVQWIVGVQFFTGGWPGTGCRGKRRCCLTS